MARLRRKILFFASALMVIGCGQSRSRPFTEAGAGTASPDQLPREDTLLGETRAKLSFPRYTPDERRLVIEEAMSFLELFAHEESKLAHYGPSVLPRAKLDELHAEAASLDDVEFHTRMLDIFVAMRDRHTQYFLPKPHACYEALLPFTLVKTQEKDGSFALRLKLDPSLSEFPDAVVAPMERVRQGARLLSYDGKEPFEAEREMVPLNAGTAVEPRELAARLLLTDRNGRSHMLPPRDTARLVLQNPSDGSLLDVEVPWTLLANDSCLNEYKREMAPQLPSGEEGHAAPRTGLGPQASLVESKEGVLSHERVERNGKAFGVVKVESFVSRALGVEQTIHEFARLLDGMRDTEGVVVDLRDNSGGTLALAEGLVQLFTPQPPLMHTFRIKNTPRARDLVAAIPSLSPWVPRFAQVSPSAAWVQGATDGDPEARILLAGQHAFGPVTILTNPACFSSCDMFAGLMQDNGAATFWGEGGWQTGGGGANAIYYSDLLEAGVPVRRLPGGQDMRVSLRQTVRTGINEGKVLEDDGVRSDRIVYPTLQDLEEEDAHIRKELFDDLLARNPGRERSWGGTGGDELFVDVPEGGKARFEVETGNTDALIVRRPGAPDERIFIAKGQQGRTTVTLGHLDSGLNRVEVVGLRKEVQAWRLVRYVRALPAPTKLSAGEILSGDGPSGTLLRGARVMAQRPGSEVWSLVEGALRTSAPGVGYANQMETSLSWFLNLAPDSHPVLELDAEIETLRYHTLTLQVKSDRQIVPVELVSLEDGSRFESLRGHLPRQKYRADLASFAGKEVEIRLLFNSDRDGASRNREKGIALFGWTLFGN